jgi:hypothetical protein
MRLDWLCKLLGCPKGAQPTPEPAPGPTPSPGEATRTDETEGRRAIFRRTLPTRILVGQTFTVTVEVEAKEDLYTISVEDKSWFPEWHVIEVPEGLWVQVPQGEKRRLNYHVQLMRAPTHFKMWGTAKVTTQGGSDVEDLTLVSQLNV